MRLNQRWTSLNKTQSELDAKLAKEANNEILFKDALLDFKTIQYFKQKINLSTEWEDLEFEDDDGILLLDKQYKNWEIELPRFDINLIPYIRLHILIRNKTTDLDDGLIFTNTSRQHIIYEVEQYQNTNFYRVKLKAGILLDNFNNEWQYQAKLNVFFIDPRECI